MPIVYDDAISSGSGIPGTAQLYVVSDYDRGRNRIDRTHAVDSIRDGGNGKSVMLTITIDPLNRFVLGAAKFTTSAVAWGIHLGTFIDGTEWMSPTGRVRIIRGKLRYTSGHRLYKLPEIREAVS